MDAAMILSYTGFLVGGIITGTVGAKKFAKKNGDELEKSDRTGGALRISEEGLSKLNELKTELKAEYLPEKEHELKCGKTKSDLMLYVSKELEEHTRRIITEIKELREEKSKRMLREKGY